MNSRSPNTSSCQWREPLDEREVEPALEVEQRPEQPQRLLAHAALHEPAEERVPVVALDDLLPAAGLRREVDAAAASRRCRIAAGVRSRSPSGSTKPAAAGSNARRVWAHAVEVDERVLVLHPERRRREAEALVDEVLAEVVLAREAHRAELAVHPPGEPAVRVDPAAEPVARLEDRDPVAGLLEQEARR